MRLGQLLDEAGLDRQTIDTLVGPIDLSRVVATDAPPWMRRLWRGPVAAMTVGSRIFLADVDLPVERLRSLLLHELVHVRQWRQVGRWVFLRRYLGDYLRARLRRRGHEEAYRSIRFEVEARRIAGV